MISEKSMSIRIIRGSGESAGEAERHEISRCRALGFGDPRVPTSRLC